MHHLNWIVRRIVRRLSRDGLLVEDPEQPWLDLEPTDTLDHLNAASIRYRIAVGRGAGGRTLTLKNPFRDGATHILFTPPNLIARPAALVPHPHINLTRCHSVFAPSSPMRHAIVPTPTHARQRRKRNDSAAAPASWQCTHPDSHNHCND
ncbi:MAG: transposase, partial [Pseudomonadales bacterium]|nr:transposase [Pseudomonadales bacterium]